MSGPLRPARPARRHRPQGSGCDIGAYELEPAATKKCKKGRKLKKGKCVKKKKKIAGPRYQQGPLTPRGPCLSGLLLLHALPLAVPLDQLPAFHALLSGWWRCGGPAAWRWGWRWCWWRWCCDLELKSPDVAGRALGTGDAALVGGRQPTGAGRVEGGTAGVNRHRLSPSAVRGECHEKRVRSEWSAGDRSATHVRRREHDVRSVQRDVACRGVGLHRRPWLPRPSARRWRRH